MIPHATAAVTHATPPTLPPHLADLRVGDIMTAPVRVVPADMLLSAAYQLMVQHAIRRLPVVAQEQLIGIVTLGDLREARPAAARSLSIHELNYHLARLTVSQVMTGHPSTVTPATSIRTAAGLMLAEKIGGLPVVDNAGVLVGMITESDLFRLIVTQWGQPMPAAG